MKLTQNKSTYGSINEIESTLVFEHHVRPIKKSQAPKQRFARGRAYINLGI